MDNKIKANISDFFSPYKSQQLKKGKTLISAFENPKNIFFIEEGWVKMFSINKNGEELILNIFKPFSFFPISLAIINTENNYYYESLTDVKFRTAPKEKVVDFLKSNPDVLFDLLKRIYKGLDGILLKMEYAMMNDAKSRLILELIIQSKRFGNKVENSVSIDTSINELALSVGLARETVSRELKSLKDKNLIMNNKKEIKIIDLKKLEAEII